MPNNIPKALLRKKFSTIESPVKPEWIKVKIQIDKINEIKKTLKSNKIVTVCEEAMCPNMSDCWAKSHATFMILGDICTRACSFCNISTGKPNHVDHMEPIRVANSVKKLKLSHVVITSVDRDDLNDGGAKHFSNTINEIKLKCPNTTIEILVPDFRNKKNSIELLSKCQIDVFNHNLETVESLYKTVRPGANYKHSLSILRNIKKLNPNLFTKSGIMIGLGEKLYEIMKLMDDLRSNDVDFITIGQYLRPTLNHLPVEKWVTPEEFNNYREIGIKKGFLEVVSGPMVRSSYRAERVLEKNNAGIA